VRLHAWYVPAPYGDAHAAVPCHGNAGNISHRLDKLAVFSDLGASVLLLDYRGYGHSEGKPDEAGTYRDAEAAYEWLRGRGRGGREPGRVRRVAGRPHRTDLAARRPVGGLILESAPSSILAVARYHYPLLAGRDVPLRALRCAVQDRRRACAAARPTQPDGRHRAFSMAEQLYAAANLRSGSYACAADTTTTSSSRPRRIAPR
jgi:pimeloyl-ACP methyl ester carboxylesterase